MSEDEKNNKRILLVDDDEFLVDMYSVKFQEAGFEVDTAMDGEKGLQKVREENFDVLLLDLVMPAVDGFEVLEKLNEEELREGMKVIVLSNQGKAENIERGESLGIDGYIVKANAIPSEVLERVKNIIQKKN